MSVLNAFLATWSRARATYGDGPPQTGDAFDQSAGLLRLRDDLDAADPDRHWSGTAAAQYARANAVHQRTLSDIADLDRRLAAQIDRSAEIVRSGRQDLDRVRRWVLDAAATVPQGPARERMLAPVIKAGLAQVGDAVIRTSNHLTAIGSDIRIIGDEYRVLGDRPKPGERSRDDGDHVQALDVPEAPPPSSYPVNDVVAEATDLAGNHVVLRRGYYDATKQQGFGWDKAYWRHHVSNPNVFTDLISHSRPVSNDNGTVVYDVPINRVHCSRGFLGILDCQDTGESVTMRIVANINEGRLDIPDGGQKGVISMYPLAGGSGVVEVQPGWTLTPPWVNNNVPIN